jgi:hypothetical protein
MTAVSVSVTCSTAKNRRRGFFIAAPVPHGLGREGAEIQDEP